MFEVKCKEFDYLTIAQSGQAFRMYPDGFCVAGDKRCRVVFGTPSFGVEGNTPHFKDLSGIVNPENPVNPANPVNIIECPDSDNAFWMHYFDLETDYSAFIASIDPCDDYLQKSAQLGQGIRILNQDPWEMLITFIISQRKNISAISSCVEAVSLKWGNKMEGYYAFPTPDRLATASQKELRDCSLGYRDEYIYRASVYVAENPGYLESLRNLDYDSLVKELMRFKGVGIKVANCVALFAYHKIDAFPVDVWIQRALDRYYPSGFPFGRYAGYAGVLQQYIFNYIRKNG